MEFFIRQQFYFSPKKVEQVLSSQIEEPQKKSGALLS